MMRSWNHAVIAGLFFVFLTTLTAYGHALYSRHIGHGEAETAVKDLKCEYKVNPLGVDIRKPRFSWVLESTQRGVVQTAYQVFVSTSRQCLEEGEADAWDSGRIP